jgi:hypothetical protein
LSKVVFDRRFPVFREFGFERVANVIEKRVERFGESPRLHGKTIGRKGVRVRRRRWLRHGVSAEIRWRKREE